MSRLPSSGSGRSRSVRISHRSGTLRPLFVSTPCMPSNTAASKPSTSILIRPTRSRSIFRALPRVVEEAGSKRTRPDTGVVIVEILRAGPDDGHCGAARPRAAGDLVGDDPITGIELGEPSDKGEILRHRLEGVHLAALAHERQRIGRPIAAIGADIDEGLASSEAALEDAFKKHFVGMEKIFLHHAMQRHVDLVLHAVEMRGREARRRRSKLLDRAAAPDIGKPERIARRIFQKEASGLWSNHGGLVT